MEALASEFQELELGLTNANIAIGRLLTSFQFMTGTMSQAFRETIRSQIAKVVNNITEKTMGHMIKGELRGKESPPPEAQ